MWRVLIDSASDSCKMKIHQTFRAIAIYKVSGVAINLICSLITSVPQTMTEQTSRYIISQGHKIIIHVLIPLLESKIQVVMLSIVGQRHPDLVSVRVGDPPCDYPDRA